MSTIYCTILVLREGDGIYFSSGMETLPEVAEASKCKTRKEIQNFLKKIQTSTDPSDIKQRYTFLHNNSENPGHSGEKSRVMHECPLPKLIEFIGLKIQEEEKEAGKKPKKKS